jgi:DNA-binding transcriptional LysR family regulator
MPLRLSLRELEVFAAVAACESVTRAAAEVALSQSAASQALAQLEQALGVPLFDRIGRGLQLNEHGRALLPRARALLDEAAALQDLFGEAALSLRLGASTTIANYLLPQRLAALRQRWPQCRVSLQVANTRDIVAAVAALQADFGLIEGPCHHPALHSLPWQQDELLVFAAANHPLAGRAVSLAELAGAPWLLREAGSGTREEVERVLLPHLGSLNVEMELGDSEAIKRAVAAGLGVSCLSRRVVAELLDSGALVPLHTALPPLQRTLWCIRHRDKAPGSSMRAFLQLDGLAPEGR